MKNKLYYIKPEKFDFPEAIKKGLIQSLKVVQDNNYSNIKLVVSLMNLVDTPPNHISNAFDSIFENKGENIVKLLKKNRGYPLKGWPTDDITTGINLLPASKFSVRHDEKTVVVLVFADENSIKKVQSSLFFTEIDLICVIYNETDNLNEILSATKAINLRETSDTNVASYTNTFSELELTIINRLKGINITDRASHTPTRNTMKSVIDDLKKNSINIEYVDFLGFLLNDVNYNLDDSIELLEWKKKYFNR